MTQELEMYLDKITEESYKDLYEDYLQAVAYDSTKF